MLMYREQEVYDMYAGIHGAGFVARLTGDTAIVADRGSSFAARYAANPSGSVDDAWAQSMASISQRASNCKDQTGNILGGGYGVNGCGGNEAMSMNSTVNTMSASFNESWIQLQDDTRDAKGNAYAGITQTCNWDCVSNPGMN